MLTFNFLCMQFTNFSPILTSLITVIGFWIAFIYKRREIKYSRLHEERFIILKDTYKRIVQLDIYIKEYMKPNNFLSDAHYNYKGLAEAYNIFLKEYLESRVFIPTDVALEIEKFRNHSSGAIDQYFVFEKYKNTGSNKGAPPDQAKLDEIEKKLKEDLPIVLRSIEDKFQKIFK